MLKVTGLNENTPYNMGNVRRAICTTNALEISRCDLQHGFCRASQSILTSHTFFVGTIFCIVHFQSVKVNATLVTRAFLRTFFFP